MNQWRYCCDHVDGDGCDVPVYVVECGEIGGVVEGELVGVGEGEHDGDIGIDDWYFAFI